MKKELVQSMGQDPGLAQPPLVHPGEDNVQFARTTGSAVAGGTQLQFVYVCENGANFAQEALINKTYYVNFKGCILCCDTRIVAIPVIKM